MPRVPSRELTPVRSVKVSDLMPLGAVWTPEEGIQDFDPALFDGTPGSP